MLWSTAIRRGYYWLTRSIRTFTIDQHSYHYFCHPYNTTWANERIVEVPIIWREVQRYQPQRVLEIGNVLHHYFPIKHWVVDKYEKAPGVINRDVVEFYPRQRFDLIVAISTLEHVGWDESPPQPRKFLKALKHLMSLLSDHGQLWMTLPVGYQPTVNKWIFRAIHQPGFNLSALLRLDIANHWQQVPLNRVKNCQYNHPFRNANAVVVVRYEMD